MFELGFWQHQRQIHEMGAIILVIAPFFMCYCREVALHWAILQNPLSGSWERLCLRLWTHFRITAYGKLHVSLTVVIYCLYRHFQIAKYTRNIKIIIAIVWKILSSNEPHLHYFGLGSMYPNVYGFIFKNYYSYFYLFFSLSMGHDKSNRGFPSPYQSFEAMGKKE